jgi:hypothetical protein
MRDWQHGFKTGDTVHVGRVDLFYGKAHRCGGRSGRRRFAAIARIQYRIRAFVAGPDAVLDAVGGARPDCGPATEEGRLSIGTNAI